MPLEHKLNVERRVKIIIRVLIVLLLLCLKKMS